MRRSAWKGKALVREDMYARAERPELVCRYGLDAALPQAVVARVVPGKSPFTTLLPPEA